MTYEFSVGDRVQLRVLGTFETGRVSRVDEAGVELTFDGVTILYPHGDATLDALSEIRRFQ